jgi:hypothetical protein
MIINLASKKQPELLNLMEVDTTQSSVSDPPPATHRPPTRPPTWAEKGKAPIGKQMPLGEIAPPDGTILITDDIALENDLDVIELEEDILDRYIAICNNRAPGQLKGQLAGPKPTPQELTVPKRQTVRLTPKVRIATVLRTTNQTKPKQATPINPTTAIPTAIPTPPAHKPYTEEEKNLWLYISNRHIPMG